MRRRLHRPPRWQRPADLLCRALPILVASCLSSSVAGGAAPRRAPCALQSLAVQALRAHLAGWYRICLLLRVDRSEGTTDSQRLGEQEHPTLWSTGGKLCRQISCHGRRTSAAVLYVRCVAPGSQTRAVVPASGASGVTSLWGPPSVRTRSAVSHTANGWVISAPGVITMLRSAQMVSTVHLSLSSSMPLDLLQARWQINSAAAMPGSPEL